MLKFYYNPKYKYTNRYIVDVSGDTDYQEKEYVNIDSPDTINGHIIYTLSTGETFSNLPTYIVDTDSGWRWFVSGITQLNSQKFQISLLRDIISESPDTWKGERAYISSGTAQNYNKYKKWNLPFTNTKVREERIKLNGSDDKSSFFVFYVNEQSNSTHPLTEQDLQISSVSVPGVTNFDYTLANINEIPGYEFLNAGNVRHYNNTKYTTSLTLATSNATYENNSWSWSVINNDWDFNSENMAGNVTDITSGYSSSFTLTNSYSGWNFDSLNLAVKQTDFANNTNSAKGSFVSAVNNFVTTWQNNQATLIPSNKITGLAPYVNKYIYDQSTTKVYTVTMTQTNGSLNKLFSTTELASLTTTLSNINWPWISNQIPSDVRFKTGSTNGYVRAKSQYTTYNYKLVELGRANAFSFNFKANKRKLPKSAVRCVNIVSDNTISDEDITQSLMLAQTNGINEDNTTGRILDIQYLPFRIATTSNSNFSITKDGTAHDLIAEFMETDDFQYHIDLPDLTDVNKETDTIKIVSPSRASQFLFSPYNNDGNMVFDAKITLKPYTSTIYIRPSTQGLLMYDWDDKDCLIIQEDFSLTNVSSAWTQYIYNNKNYSNIFEREIQGREYERSWERKVEKASLKSEEWNARNINSQKARTYSGNIPILSDIAGAIASGHADSNYLSAVQTDLKYNQALYEEGLSLSRDLYNYQLENIKSQPLIPSKITTIDCKFLDGIYLEYYSTNSTELASIENFYFYNGNRIDDYGTFGAYWGNFVRGKIILSLHYTQPEIDELNRRLNMGIFTGGI